MPRNMSFMLTKDQIKNQTKTVTRRKGWNFLKPGDILNACYKCQGLKKGEKVEKLCQIRVLSVSNESLLLIARRGECSKEGFPGIKPYEFVEMFCREMGGDDEQMVNRIEFEYI